MLDTLRIYEELKQTMDAPAAEKIAATFGMVYEQLHASVAAQWFGTLRDAIDQLADAQHRTAERLDRLEQAVTALAEAQQRTEAELNRLAEAQRRAEERLDRLEQALTALAEAQQRTEAELNRLAEAQRRAEERLDRLEQAVTALAEAQQRTEERLNQLAEAQRRTEERLNQLAEAQRRTEAELRQLVEEHRETRRQLGGLAMTVGYTLENEAYKKLPELLQRDHNVIVQGRLKRQYVRDKEGQYLEVNIFGQAQRDGTQVTIVGESRAQLSKNEIDTFIRKKLKRLQGVYPTLFPVLVTHMISAYDVEDYAKQKGIAVYYSYDF